MYYLKDDEKSNLLVFRVKLTSLRFQTRINKKVSFYDATGFELELEESFSIE